MVLSHVHSRTEYLKKSLNNYSELLDSQFLGRGYADIIPEIEILYKGTFEQILAVLIAGLIHSRVLYLPAVCEEL